MKRTSIAFMALFIVVGLTTSAMALGVTISSGGESINLSYLQVADRFVIPEQTIYFSGGDRVTITGSASADPLITYSLTVTDFGAPSDFGFTFGIPVLAGELPAQPTVVNSSIVGGLTDFTGDGVYITATHPTGLSRTIIWKALISPGVWDLRPSSDQDQLALYIPMAPIPLVLLPVRPGRIPAAFSPPRRSA